MPKFINISGPIAVGKSTKHKIKEYFEQLRPSSLGCKKPIRVLSVKKLGMGTGNLNYVVQANKKKFIFRLNMDPKNKKKTPYEFNALKTVEKQKVGPKAWLMDTSKKFFSSDFLIINYTEGKTVNKLKPYLSKKMIRELGTLLGRMHSTKINAQQKKKLYDETNRNNYLKIIQKRITYIKKHIQNKKLLILLDEWMQQLKKEIKKEKKVSVVLTQGDFCEQNIIYSKGKYTLIDFEDLHITDPAVDIARVFIDFGRPFSQEERTIFFRAYLKITKNKDVDLLARAKRFIPLQYLDLLSWSIEHSLKIKNKEMDIEFLKENDLSKDIKYASLVLKEGVKEGVINKEYKDLDFKEIILKKKDEYALFAKKYDYEMDDDLTNATYKEWRNELKSAIKKYKIKVKTIVDLACGTGNTTIPWLKERYNVIGVDISNSMLKIAKKKSKKVKWYKQNIKNLKIKEKADVVTCHYDSLNHITKKRELKKVFDNVFDLLNNEGLFIFDLIPEKAFEWLDGRKTKSDEEKGYRIIRNTYHKKTKIIKCTQTWFVKKGKKHIKKEENVITERAYPKEEVKKMLEKTGFKILKIKHQKTPEWDGKPRRLIYITQKQ